MGKAVDLNALAKNLGARAKYEPDTFAGLVYSLNSKITVLVFPTGKIISTGTKNSQETKTAFELIMKKARI